MSSLKPKLLYQFAVSFLYTGAPLLIFPYISRVLGPDKIGRINLVDYAAQFFILFASFGIPFYGVREVARVRHNKPQLARVSSELLVIHILTTMISIGLFAAFIFLKHDTFNDRQLILLSFINMGGSAFALEWLVHGLEDFRFLARRSFIVKFLSLVAVFVFIRQSSDYARYYLLLIVANLLPVAIDIGYAFNKKIFFQKDLALKKHIRPLSIFFLTTVTLSIYTFFDSVILGMVAGTLAVGFYTTSLKVIRLTHGLITDLGGVLLPRVSYLVETGNRKEIARIINKSIVYVLTITIPASIFIFFAADEMIFALGGKAFTESVPVLKILSCLPVMIGLTNIFFIQVLLPFHKEKIMLAGVLQGSLVSIVCNLVLCRLYAQEGAAISCVAAEMVVGIYLGIRAGGIISFSVDKKTVAGILLSSALFIPVILGARVFLSNPIFVLLFSVAVCGLLYGSLQYFVFRNVVIQEMIVFLNEKILKRRK